MAHVTLSANCSWEASLVGLLTLVLSGLVGWQVWHPPEQGYERALDGIVNLLKIAPRHLPLEEM